MYRVTNNESDRPQPTALDQFRFQFPFPDRLRIDRYTCTCCCLSVCLSIRSVGSGRWACKQQQDATVQYCTVLCVVQQSIYVIRSTSLSVCPSRQGSVLLCDVLVLQESMYVRHTCILLFFFFRSSLVLPVGAMHYMIHATGTLCTCTYLCPYLYLYLYTP